MKKTLLLPALALLPLLSIGQMVTDTVSIGAGYANQVWYSLENGVVKEEPKDNWDLAFEINGLTSGVRLNGTQGHSLFVYPNGDTGSWDNIDTTGWSSWNQSHNSDTSWSYGAFNQNFSADPFDLGWGMYNVQTHHVTGDSLYLLVTAGGDLKKVWLNSLAGGVYTFTIADLDGSNEIIRTVDKMDYAGRHFGYYSITNDETLNREPDFGSWDLVFTQYAAVIPGFGAYPSTGVLHDKGNTTAQVYPITDPMTTDEWTVANYSSEINTIGHEWKSYDFMSNAWSIADSTVFFTKVEETGNIWRIVFTDFGGQADGNFIFHKELVFDAVSVDEANEASSFLNIYPNPSTNGQVSVVYDFATETQPMNLTLTDMHGRVVRNHALPVSNGLMTEVLNTGDLSAGMYILSIQGEHTRVAERLIVR